MTAAYPCPTSLPVTTINPIPATTVNDQTAASRVSTFVTVTRIPTDSEIDRTPPVWLLVTVVAVVVVAIACTCVCLVVITLMLKKGLQQGTHAKKGRLQNIIIEDELYSQASVKSYKSSDSVKSKVGIAIISKCLSVY